MTADGGLFDAPAAQQLWLPETARLFLGSKPSYSKYGAQKRAQCDLCVLMCHELGPDHWQQAPIPRSARHRRTCCDTTYLICDGHKQLCLEKEPKQVKPITYRRAR